MRLRQAHAILDIAAALLRSDLDFGLCPFEHEDSIDQKDDRISGCAECTDPDRPGIAGRIYNVDLRPGPGEFEINVQVIEGYEPGGDVVYADMFSVDRNSDDAEPFAVGLGVHVADQMVAAIREHERPFEVAYEARTATP